ncbi:EAL domain-containing protein [Arthrobacter sp. H20]|uniref:sensor domain-containing protein n=1 Tax=Arthrobacter sp. H20 TaxID=1267981 RepID=UPI0012DEBE34|nr:EAL domain-containing protein [Arthrobacter sp. H20]
MTPLRPSVPADGNLAPYAQAGLRETLDALPVAVALLTADGMISAVNREWEGFTQPFGETLPPQKAGVSYLAACEGAAGKGDVAAVEVSRGLRTVLAGDQQNLALEYQSNGGERWIRTRICRSDSGGLVITHIDITAQMLGQQRISFQASLLDAVGQSVVAIDMQGRITYWNDASETMLGWCAGDAIGRHLAELALFDSGSRAAAIIAQVSSGEAWTGEHWTTHRNGHRLSVYSTITPLYDTAGQVIAVIDVSTDTTESQRAQAEMSRLSSLVEFSNDAINGATLDGIITSWNAGAERIYGYSAEEAIGKSVLMLSPEERSGADEVLRDRLRSGQPVIGQYIRGMRKDGSLLDISLTLSPMYGESGQLIGSSAVARDVSEINRLRAASDLERDRLAAAQEMAHVGSVEWDALADRVWRSDEYCRIHGLPVTTEGSRGPLLRAVHPDDRDRIDLIWQELLVSGTSIDFTYRVEPSDGDIRWVYARATLERDDDGKPIKMQGTALDITERKLGEQALERLAFRDALTGLANRALLTESIELAIAECGQRGTQVGVLFLDVDRFKVINDGLGHAAGDSLLVQLASRLLAAVRPEDTLARFAGDEFVIVCSDMTEHSAKKLASRIRAAVQTPFELLEREVFVDVSIGIAISSGVDTSESLLRNSDAAMYRAKGGGVTEAVVFDEAMHLRAELRLVVESELPRAIERDQLRVHYQPVMDIAGGDPIGFEALLRWQHPEHGLIGPDSFIPIAEETGQIVPIGLWVLREALREAQRWRSELPGAESWRISVNFSARQLQDPGLNDAVADAIGTAGIDPGAVVLEITESVLMGDADQSLRTLAKLRSLGIGIAVDDFGTGYSSLSYLKRFPVTALKIDRSFVDGLGGSDVHAGPIVEAIAAMARALGLRVVAEGVETCGQLEELRRMRVQFAQGYLWSPAVPADRVPDWFAGHRAQIVRGT